MAAGRFVSLAVLLAACAGPHGKRPSVVDLRVCVSDERFVEPWSKSFVKAVTGDPREGRECDFTALPGSLNDDKVVLRSAFDGSVLAELEGPVDFVPRLAALSLAPESEPYKRLKKQREKSGF
jgi:hypothetical protein